MLHEFITQNRDDIIGRCREKVSTRSEPPATKLEIDHGVPMFLDQLVEELRLGLTTSSEITRTAIQHGRDLLGQGFTVSQVVHDYGDVCQAVTELALEVNAPIGTADFRMLNRCLDDAIAGAVTEYGRERHREVHGDERSDHERLGTLARGIQICLDTAIVAMTTIRSGTVGAGGVTSSVLERSLEGAHELNDRLLAAIESGRDTLTAGNVPVERAKIADVK